MLGISLSLTPGNPIFNPGFSLNTFMARQSARLYLDFTKTNTTWQDSSATTPADEIGEVIGRVDDAITSTSSPNNAVQSGLDSLKPVRQSTGAKFDNSDDNHLSTYAPDTSGANFIVGLVTVPASISATQIVCGSSNGASNVLHIALRTTGFVAGGLGTDTSATIIGSTDRRGATIVYGISHDASQVRLFDDSLGIVYQAARNGNPDNRAFRVGALNSNGSAANFFGGSVKKLVAGREYLTAARFAQIRAALLA